MIHKVYIYALVILFNSSIMLADAKGGDIEEEIFRGIFGLTKDLVLKDAQKNFYCAKKGISANNCDREYEMYRKHKRDRLAPSVEPD